MSPWTGSQEATEPLQHKREPFGPSHLRRSTMSNILSCLILSSVVAVVTGGVNHELGKCPEVNLEGPHPVTLNCSDPSYARATLVQWRWTDTFGKRKELLLLQVLNGSITKSPGHADLELSAESCVKHGDCSLTVTSMREAPGIYHCIVWTTKWISEQKIRLVHKESSFHLPIIVGVTLAIIGVMCLITTVILIYRRCTVIRQGQPGTYVNVPLPGGHSNQDSPITDSTYMSLNLNDQSLYSQLHR
ncbi:uncharacterized protein LOC119974550 isoform X1 [Scyliorhinus canicula]|uniref:uncharacterized protein LOC119974550 isoform X1 n=1 Tax=Scyliorhinus canicula TaxID=7830 RepID=UPI0018F61C0E|nr:uncharacterized protein LOC119974550 isoform X1 [Scyliorhinus canicula]XP_038669463.1 uncharacterized protein LOC119974550 isoform X1 [Scyliorhinus canicula]